MVTDDNPRSEDPAAIRAEILAGAARPGAAERRRDRRPASGDRRTRCATARAGDTVLIAGKGHETGQEIAGRGAARSTTGEVAATLEIAARSQEVEP